MENDFIVYETSQAEIYKSNGKQVLECSNDGSRFVFIKTIGEGSFSKVKLAERRMVNSENIEIYSEYAIKIMHKGILKRQRCVIYDSNNQMKMTNNWEKIENEIAIWRLLCNVNIIRLYEIIDVPELEHVYLIIEYADGGQIMKWNTNAQGYELSPSLLLDLKTKYPQIYEKHNELEATGKIIFQQVCSGLEYLHRKFIVHKDLKPDNILYCSKENKFKITDFTISEKLESSESLCYNPPGTTPFQAPESMLSGVGFLGTKADIWALGVCIYTLVSGGKLPFWENESEIYTQMAIQNNPVVFPSTFSNEVVDLLQGLLNKDPIQRISLQQTISHPWLS
jgi:serine/threonine protein kinase